MKAVSKTVLGHLVKTSSHTKNFSIKLTPASQIGLRNYSSKSEQNYLHVVEEFTTGLDRVEQLSGAYQTENLYPSLTDLKKKLGISSTISLDQIQEINAEKIHSFYVMGQITARRDSGKKAHFFKLKQYNTEYDLVAHWSRFPLNNEKETLELAQFHNKFNSLKIGDHILVKVEKSVSMKGVVCLRPLEFAAILAPRLVDAADVLKSEDKAMNNKVLLSLNEKEMYRHRNIVDGVLLRSRLNKLVRNLLDGQGFIEVETPILNMKSGGANATPFTTQMKNADKNNNELQLRIAPELWLKRLVIAGYDSVYELGKNFRNEGVDITHNPEFTSLEVYKKYYDLEDMIKLGEKLLECVYLEFENEIEGELFNAFKDQEFKFKRVDCIKQLSEDYKVDLETLEAALKNASQTNSSLQLLAVFSSSSLFQQRFKNIKLDTISVQTLLKKLVDYVESDHCNSSSPAILVNHPGLLSPLAKQDRNGVRSFRYELFIEGIEYMNAYEEQNDPAIQKDQFAKQQEVKDDDEVMPLDLNYVKTMKYGLGPTGGLGVGIDRILMLVSGKESMASVLSFGNIENVKRQ